MRLVRGLLGVVLSSAFLCSAVAVTYAQPPAPETEGYAALFEISPREESLGRRNAGQESVAAFNPTTKQLQFFSLGGGSLKSETRREVEGSVVAVTRHPQGYVVATGAGRGELDAPIRLWLYVVDGGAVRKAKVFERPSERSQVTQLAWDSGKLWVTFFESKYMTKTGYFVPRDGAEWSFTEVFSTRLGTSVDVAGATLVIGRPYGDVQGQDGDVLLFESGKQVVLPSYRGVRNIRILAGERVPRILVADGWHQNYGQFAQARISLLQRDPVSGRYALQLVHRDERQYEYTRLMPFSLHGREFVGACGNKKLEVVPLMTDGNGTTLYNRSRDDISFECALLASDGKQAWFVVMDQGLHVVAFGG